LRRIVFTKKTSLDYEKRKEWEWKKKAPREKFNELLKSTNQDEIKIRDELTEIIVVVFMQYVATINNNKWMLNFKCIYEGLLKA
jgi:hypothetical protein